MGEAHAQAHTQLRTQVMSQSLPQSPVPQLSRSRPQPGTRGPALERLQIMDPSRGLPFPPPPGKQGLNPGPFLDSHLPPSSSRRAPGQGPTVCHHCGQMASPLRDTVFPFLRQGLEKMKASR